MGVHRLVLALSLFFIVSISGGCAVYSSDSSSFDHQLKVFVQPYSFNFAAWEFKAVSAELKRKVIDRPPESSLNSQSVIKYFSYMTRIHSLQSDIQSVRSGQGQGELTQYLTRLSEAESQASTLKNITEQTISRQINETLASQAIYNPLINKCEFNFPPVNFSLEKPLFVLIVSPTNKIERMRDFTLKQNILPDQIQALESSVDSLNVSSLVVEIGGMAAMYPTFVTKNADLRWTIDTAAHEWVHQYLAFKPLGFRYVLDLLGISRNTEIATINETVADIAGKELGALVYDKYYAQFLTGQVSEEAVPDQPGFDYNAAMRNIRLNVDSYLAQGQIEEAERYMEAQRQFLNTRGYYIRKLNQAYFAFYGSYADSPTSVDPIGDEIKLLRKQSLSIKEFLDTASGLSNAQDLRDTVNRYQ